MDVITSAMRVVFEGQPYDITGVIKRYGQPPAAGQLSKRISIQKRAPGVGTLGQAIESWTPVADEIWASVEFLRGREFFAAGQTQSEVTARIVMRWGLGAWLELMCATGSGDGR